MSGNPEPLVWQSREIVLPRPLNFGAVQVVCSGDWTLDVYAADETGAMVQRHSQAGLSGLFSFTLPSGYCSDRYQFRISGVGVFRELRVATSMVELRGL
jgi:hypothetical protein